MPPTSSLPPLPRVARYRSSLTRAGSVDHPWSYLSVPSGDTTRLGGFAEVQALARDVVTLGARHTAVVQCRPDLSIVGVLLDPPHEVSLRIAAAPRPVLQAPAVVVVEVTTRPRVVGPDDLEGLHAVRSILQRQNVGLLDVVRTDGDVVISLSIAGGLTDPWRRDTTASPASVAS
ncbi:MAG: hypothetical protein ACO3AV_06185 [Ilumatobacteraceae bacterium]